MNRLLRLSLLALAAPMLAWAQTPPTLDKIKQSGTMALAYREASIPFSYLDDKAKPTGFGFEICEKIADRVKAATGRADMQKQYQAVTSANRIPLLQNGTIDIECGSTTNNLGRQQQVDFTYSFYVTGNRLMASKASGIKEIENISGKSVGVAAGTSNERILNTLIEELKIECRAVFVLDPNGKVLHAEYVNEVTSEPDYEAAMEALRSKL